MRKIDQETTEDLQQEIRISAAKDLARQVTAGNLSEESIESMAFEFGRRIGVEVKTDDKSTKVKPSQ